MKTATKLSLIAAAGLLLWASAASAQTSTTGSVRGIVTDTSTGEAVIGATVVATSPSLQGTQAVITDTSGAYYISSLPVGTYQVTVFYADGQWNRTNVLVQLGKESVVNIKINTATGAGEVITIEGRAPIIDQGSTKTGVTITEDYTKNIPTGRTFGAVLGAAAGSQGDLFGTSVSGSTSVENQYIVDGLNTTDPAFGLLSTNLPNEFVQQTEVITGGYNAEYGRSTGGIINVVTKSGSNEFHGSVFGYLTPGAFVAERKSITSARTSIDVESNLSYQADIGAELGGPIVKDKLWFHVGFNPSFGSTDLVRRLQRQVDGNGDGQVDVDDNGFKIFEPIDGSEKNFTESAQTYYYTAKLSGAVTPEHRGQISVLGSPNTGNVYTTLNGETTSGAFDITNNVLDVTAKWTSKFNNNKTQVDVIAGHHLDTHNEEPSFAVTGSDSLIRFNYTRPITDFAASEGSIPPECMGSISAEEPNCPVFLYRLDGVGFLEDRDTTRTAATASVTQRLKLAGHHTFKGGVDVENQTYTANRRYTGGYLVTDYGGYYRTREFWTPDNMGELPCGASINGEVLGNCSYQDFIEAATTTRNIGAYLQDSWSVLPNLTFNAGLRWEQQTLFNADHIVGKTSPATGRVIPEEALTLNNMLAPRLGAIYDWTKEGRSKVYAHWGRFYESIPMDINVRGFGGEVLTLGFYPTDACDIAANNSTGECNLGPENAFPASALGLPGDGPALLPLGSGDFSIAPGIEAQYLDEWLIGTEYELFADFKVGAAFTHRELKNIIEDVSFDGGTTYILANPGRADEAGIDEVEAEAMALLNDGDPSNDARGEYLQFLTSQFRGIASFDAPHREYNGVTLTAEKRFTRDFLVKASYTFSDLTGNFPGLFSPETGQLDPNLTSMYDLPDLMANRYGDMSADRPHNFKLDGFYRWVHPTAGLVIVGASFRAISGIPINALGAHPVYGDDEAYVLPRGSIGRTPFLTSVDTHLAYGRELSDGMVVQAFVDVFNLFNQQETAAVDATYTSDFVNPIVGGDEEDLRHLKSIVDGSPTNVTAAPNPNFKNTSARQAPLSVRFGVRLTF